MSVTHLAPPTLEDFLQWENQQAGRFEFLGGVIVAMVGATVRHNLIAGNIRAQWLRAARGGPCRVYGEGLKLIAGEISTYPDAFVLCSQVPPEATHVTDAELVLEVLSPSTQDYDLGPKRDAYLTLPSLKAYIVVWQDHRELRVYTRNEGGGWLATPVPADSVQCDLPLELFSLSLSDIYEGTDA